MLKKGGITRRTDHTPIATVQPTDAHELRGSGQLPTEISPVKRDDVRHTIPIQGSLRGIICSVHQSLDNS